MTISPKSYPVAVILAALFGVIGVHHFYTGRILLGICDFGLFVTTIVFYVLFLETFEFNYLILAGVFSIVDAIHTVIVTYRLLVGEERDGQGRVIAYPGQFKDSEVSS